MSTSTLQIYSITPHPTAEYWSVCKVEALFETPFLDLVYRAAQIHRKNFNPRAIQLSTLMSIKTGGCPEDCGYCPQSARYQTGVQNQELLNVEDIVAKAKIAKARGAGRFCMGAAWRGPKPKDIAKVTEIIKAVKALGMETCGTFGLLQDGMAEELKDAGLDYYNHNLDTAPEHYSEVIGTRRFDDRISTLGKVRKAGLKVCCGGIVGMNETRKERAGLIASLANLDPQPESVPINQLVKIEGTPLADAEELDWTEFVRTIAVFFQHQADRFAANANFRGIEIMHFSALSLQGLRVAIPTAAVAAVTGTDLVDRWLSAIPDVVATGLQVAGGFIVVVGYAMVINMMNVRALMPFFFLGFVLAAFIPDFNLVGLGIIGACLAVVYVQLNPLYHDSIAMPAVARTGPNYDNELE